MNKRMKTVIIVCCVLIVIAAVIIIIFQHPAFGPKQDKMTRQRIEASPNYRDGAFQNQVPTPQMTSEGGMASAMWRFLTGGDKNKVPKEPLEVVKTDLKSLPKDQDWLVWFGHSSYLFCLNKRLYLVDPVLKMEFPASVMMTPFKGTDVYTPEDMPEVDYLIITHEHWDHLDYATLRDLREKVKHVICPIGIAAYLEHWHYDKGMIKEMDWYENYADEALTIYTLPTRHFSNRLLKRNQTLWASFMVEDEGRRVYIGGDGGYDDRFKEIHEKFESIDLAVMENGQYNKDWAYIHLMPKDLEQAILDLKAEKVVTVHHDKFALAMHPWSEPDSVAQDIAKRNGINLLDKHIGEVIYF